MKIISAAAAAVSLTALAAAIYKWKGKKNDEEPEVYCTCHRPSLPKDFTITAHTGCMGTKANSVDSIIAADAAGADIVEFDLRFDKSGTPVLTHDAHYDKNTVTLAQAFGVLSGLKLRVNIDVKDTAYLEKVPPLAEEYGLKDRIFFTGIGKDFVPAVKEKCPDIPYYLNLNILPHLPDDEKYVESVIKQLRDSGAVGLNTNRLNVTAKLVRAVQDAGFPVSVWTATTAAQIHKAAAAGPDNITTKDPALAAKLCR